MTDKLEQQRIRRRIRALKKLGFDSKYNKNSKEDMYKFIFTDDNGKNGLKCEKMAENGNVFIAKFSGVETIEQAENLRGKVLYINRKAVKLEKGRYFIQDIIGSKVFDAETGEEYGVISDVSQTGANDVWHIKKNDKEYLIPVIPPVVKEVDIEAGEIKIIALKGIFDDED